MQTWVSGKTERFIHRKEGSRKWALEAVLRPTVEDIYSINSRTNTYSMGHQSKMPSQKPSLRKRLNKKKKRRFGPLKGKCREFAKLPGVKLALFIEFEKNDRDSKIKKEYYSLRSCRNTSWLRNVDDIVSVVPITISNV
jgi:hypothetical protein